MSSQDDDGRGQLGDALQKTTLNDKAGDAEARASARVEESSQGSNKSPVDDIKRRHDQDSDQDIHKDGSSSQDIENINSGRTTPSPQDSSLGISFVTSPEVTLDAEDTSTNPTTSLTRRKSSMTTMGSRLKRAASTEKHVTIVDTTGNTAASEENKDKVEQASEAKTQEDEATKEELAKILMQFDPLAETKQQNEQETSVTIVDRGLTSTDALRNAEASTLSPNLSLSSSSSPKTPQLLDSPRTSHDVQVAMSEKAKSGSASSSKKKNESRPKEKTALTLETPRANDRGGESARSEPPKLKDIPFDFHKFLEQMRHRSAIPITRYFQSFLKEFDRKPWTVNEQIKIIHDFLDFITGKMEMCDLWKNASDQEFENVKEGMEKLVMNRLFAYTFSPSTTDDAERDEVLTQKIRIFRWIREEHLDIPNSPHNEAYLNNAQAELKKINSYKAPRDKVICILNCCKFIFTLIRRSEGNSKGADTFLPILIYVVLRSNPPNLVSNVQYISRFRNPDKLQAEAGYYLASLMGAISFIESLEASSLSISPEEFDQQIEKTMTELSQERAEAAATDAANASASATASPDPSGSGGHRKQNSKLATLLAGTAATKSSMRQQQQQQQQRGTMNEKQYLAAEAAQQEKQVAQQGQGGRGRASPAPSGSSSILNPAAALIERGANFATKTIQKPLDLIERMFQDSGDDEEMAKPYPSRSAPQQYQQQQQQQQSYSDAPPPLPHRVNQQLQQQSHGQRPGMSGRDDSFTEFVYVPAGQQLQQPAPLQQQQSNAFYQDQVYPGNAQLAQNTQQQHQQQSMEEYLQALETLTDMFPSCERQVCDVILQANDGRLSPSIDTLLEISSANESKGQQQQQTADEEEHEQLQADYLIDKEETAEISKDV